MWRPRRSSISPVLPSVRSNPCPWLSIRGRYGTHTAHPGGSQRVCGECHVRDLCPARVSAQCQPPVRGGQPGGRYRGEDSGGGGKLSGQRHLCGRCRDGGTPVPVGGPEVW